MNIGGKNMAKAFASFVVISMIMLQQVNGQYPTTAPPATCPSSFSTPATTSTPESLTNSIPKRWLSNKNVNANVAANSDGGGLNATLNGTLYGTLNDFAIKDSNGSLKLNSKFRKNILGLLTDGKIKILFLTFLYDTGTGSGTDGTCCLVDATMLLYNGKDFGVVAQLIDVCWLGGCFFLLIFCRGKCRKYEGSFVL